MSNRGDWMQTYSGGMFYPGDPRPGEVFIVDIVAGLSRDCRFAGQCREFYSVAEHSVRASYLVAPAQAMQALLHDASEAYLRDLPKGVKRLCRDYQGLEHRVAKAIGDQFGVELVNLHPDVKRADLIMLATERRDLMPNPPAPWDDIENVRPLTEVIEPWSEEEAAQEFMMRFVELGGSHRYELAAA